MFTMPDNTGPTKYGIFSDNAKMDTSGISATETQTMWVGPCGKAVEKTIKGPVISGGEIRDAALHAGVQNGVTITDEVYLKKIATLVNAGSSLWGAADDVAREYAFMLRGRDKHIHGGY
jgi:hypothetical protein